MYLMVLNFLKSSLGKYIMIGVAVAGIVLYYNIQIWSLESDNKDLTLNLKRTELNLDITKGNLSKCITINKENDVVLVEFEKDIDILKQNQAITVQGKDKVILRLKNTIKELRVPVIYPEPEIVYKECKVKIKQLGESDENSTLHNLNHIGF